MSLTYEQAVDEILGMFHAAWDPTTYESYFDNIREQRDKDQDPWVEVQIRHYHGRQAALAPFFTRYGLMIAVINYPSGKGLSESYRLAKLVSDAYEGKSSPGGVWFRDTRISEHGNDGAFFKTSVIVDFQYTEIKGS